MKKILVSSKKLSKKNKIFITLKKLYFIFYAYQKKMPFYLPVKNLISLIILTSKKLI